MSVVLASSPATSVTFLLTPVPLVRVPNGSLTMYDVHVVDHYQNKLLDCPVWRP